MRKEQTRKHHNDKVASKKIAATAFAKFRDEQKQRLKHALDEVHALERERKKMSFTDAVVQMVERDGVEQTQRKIALHLHLTHT